MSRAGLVVGRLTVEASGPGTVRITRPECRYRFMFDDGTTLDVLTDRDDSTVREAVLAWADKEAIAGVATVPEQAVLAL